MSVAGGWYSRSNPISTRLAHGQAVATCLVFVHQAYTRDVHLPRMTAVLTASHSNLHVSSCLWLYKPAELGKAEWEFIRKSPAWAVDAWGLGCLMKEVVKVSCEDMKSVQNPVHHKVT